MFAFCLSVLFLCIVCLVGLHQSTSTWCPMVTAHIVLAKRLINRELYKKQTWKYPGSKFKF